MTTRRQVPPIPEGKYEILGGYTVGGMGRIYKVRHRYLDEVRAIKVMRKLAADDSDMRQRFLREAQLAAALRHPNLARVHDFAVSDDGTPYMVQEWVEGSDLRRILGSNGSPNVPPPLPIAIAIATQVLAALAHLHDRELVHRDVSPDNVMVACPSDGELEVKLIDLGIAKSVHSEVHMTRRGLFIGKLRYAAPEILASTERVEPDPRSDLYSFAVLLYELLTGKCPIVGDRESQIVASHVLEPPLAFEVTDPEGRVPESVRAIVLRGLEKRPEARFQSAREFSDALRRAGGAQVAGVREVSVFSESTVELRKPELDTDAERLAQAQEELDRAFDPAAEGSGSEVVDWIKQVQSIYRKQGKPVAGLATTMVILAQRYPRRVLLGGLSLLLLATLGVTGLLSGEERTPGRVLSQEPIRSDEGTFESQSPTADSGELVDPERPGEARVESAAPGVAGGSTADAAPATKTAPRRRTVMLVSSSAELTNVVVRELGSEFVVLIRDSLAQARAELVGSTGGFALRLSATSRPVSLEIYDTLMPTCEVAVTAELLRLPEGSSVFAQTSRQKAPQCGEALERAGLLLAKEVEPRIRESLGG